MAVIQCKCERYKMAYLGDRPADSIDLVAGHTPGGCPLPIAAEPVRRDEVSPAEKPLAEVIAELRKLHEAATPAPWHTEPVEWRDDKSRSDGIWADNRSDEIVTTDSGSYGPDMPDATLIVEMRNALPRLLDAASDLSNFQRALERVRQAIIAAEKQQGILHAYKTAGCDSANIPSEVDDFLRYGAARDRAASAMLAMLVRIRKAMDSPLMGLSASLSLYEETDKAIATAREAGIEPEAGP